MRLKLSAGVEIDVLDIGKDQTVYAKVWDLDFAYAKKTAKALTVEQVLADLAPTAPADKIAACAEVLEGILGLPVEEDEPWEPTEAQLEYFGDTA